jgi:tetrahydromethanopterin S-methyltransferase subunit H
MSSQSSANGGALETEVTDATSDPDVIVAEIEQTREAMSETIESIGQILDPSRLSEQAISTASEVTEQAVTAVTEVTAQAREAAAEVTVQARDAAIEVTRYAIDEAKAAVQELANQATTAVRASTIGRIEEMAAYTRGTAQAAQTDLVSLVKQNPIPAATGIGPARARATAPECMNRMEAGPTSRARRVRWRAR